MSARGAEIRPGIMEGPHHPQNLPKVEEAEVEVAVAEAEVVEATKWSATDVSRKVILSLRIWSICQIFFWSFKKFSYI